MPATAGSTDRTPPDTCRLCRNKRHWARECPNREAEAAAKIQVKTNVSEVVPNDSNVCSSETYLDITLKVGSKNRAVMCLLDTGCDKCILPGKYARRLRLRPAEKTVYAANGTEIAILGVATLKFILNGQELSGDFLVTDNIDEIILGYDFLKRYGCHSLFDECALVVNGRKCVLNHRPSKAKIRRIYVRSPISVPADCSVNVPVKLPMSDRYAVAADWVNEATELRPGLLVARTLMPDCDKFAAVPVINVSGREQFLRSDLCLGSAVPGECLNDGTQVKMPAQNVSLMANGQQSVNTACESDMCDSGLRSAGRAASDGAGEGVAALASIVAGPVAHPTPAPKDMPVPSGQLCNQPRCAAVDCQPENSVDAKTRLCDDLSGKSEGDLYAMFDADFVHVEPLFDNLPADMGHEEKRKVAELIIQNADVFSRHEYDLGVTFGFTPH